MTKGSRPARPADLSRLARVHAASTAADAAVAAVLAGTFFFDLPIDQARGRVALWLVCTLAPFAVVAPSLGGAMRRLPPSGAALAAVGAARAAAALTLAFVLHGPACYAVSFAVLVLGEAYATLRRALVPVAVTQPEDLVAANAFLSRVGSLSGPVGGGAGLAALAAGGPLLALAVAAGTHAAAARAARGVPAPAEPAVTPAAPEPAGPPAATRRGARPGRRLAPPARTALVTMASLRAASGCTFLAVAFDARGSAGTPWLLAAAGAAVTAGSLGGTFVSPRLRRRLGDEGRVLAAVAAAAGAAAIGAFAGGGPAAVVGLALVLALASSAGRHAYDGAVQRTVPGGRRRATFARAEVLLQASWVAGALVATAASLAPRAAAAAAAAAITVLLPAAALGGPVAVRARVTGRRPRVAAGVAVLAGRACAPDGPGRPASAA
ncbi:MAG: hypothetical protein KatS3mg009_2685 [Acidimicrobiia bacterium]|nr:MAG: hypothetical protein KatS3mg009_2685 [Acidimicrobiia bacterium]